MFSRNLKRRVKVILLNHLYFVAKFSAFLCWALLYLMVMRMTVFKSSIDIPVEKDWPLVTDNYDKWRVPLVVEDEPETNKNFELEEPDNETHVDLNKRAATVQNVCRIRNLSSQSVNTNEFFVEHQHGLVWCNIFKAASTFWLHKLNILGGYERKFLMRTRHYPLVLARKKYPPPSVEELSDAVNTPGVISLIVVREPFVRLLSAYRDKLEVPPRYYRTLAKTIVDNYKANAQKEEKNRGPTFYEFVSYLIDQHKDDKTSFDEHWAPYYKFCSPCAVNFSVVAKVETLSRDSSFVLQQLGLDRGLNNEVKDRKKYFERVLNKSKDGRRTKALVKYYFRQLNKNMLDKLLEIYGIDFEMFGYDPTVYYSYVRK